MNTKKAIERVLTSYLRARKEPFANHPLANFIRQEFIKTVKPYADTLDQNFIVRGSAGQGVWARSPWIAFFDPLVTDSAQRGYYPVYLFREDMAGVYLSLNQGMTEAKNLYSSDAKTALIARAGNFRAMLGTQVASFSAESIDLAPSNKTNDSAFYEAGNIVSVYYDAANLPSNKAITADLIKMLQLYKLLITEDANGGDLSEGAPPEILLEDASKLRMHMRIERNASLAKKVKSILGYSCQVCQMNFEDVYGEVGKDYIEAHHIQPLASVKGQVLKRDPAKDFAVLCANCHRMIHRSGCESVEDFKKLLKRV